ncbi:MAG: serine/threonine protein kinase [Deltaproteobacteria bacterium]|nr:serine/threonine protein kinase [Deltaproteobacteria bacterium]
MIYLDKANADPLIGRIVDGRYRISERIGGGAMGAVYRAEQIGLNRSIALKLLKHDLHWTEDTVLRFQREAHAASALTHPNTVRVFDFGATQEGILFLAMEILVGEPVTNYLRRNKVLGVKEAVVYGQQILRSLAEAHAKGIIHRDIKPDNVFLARVKGQDSPVVKILDFGIAKAIAGERTIDQFETQDGTVFGTPRYMSPEQAQGKTIDTRSDLYAVGTTLFEFLVGHPPFTDKDAVIVMAKHIREQAPPLRRVRPDRPIPLSLEKVVQKSLKKNPAERFQSAEEFAQALADCLPDVERLEQAVSKRGLKKLLSQARLFPREKLWISAGMALGLIATALFIAGIEKKASLLDEPSATISDNDSPRGEPTASEPLSDSRKAPQEAKILLKSIPPGADVWYRGEIIGLTPLKLATNKSVSKTVRLSKPGYTDVVAVVSPDKESMVIKLQAVADKAYPTELSKSTTDKSSARAKQTHLKRDRNETAGSPYKKFE